MNEEQYELLKKTYALVSENNRMMHAARRSAFIGGVIKIIIYVAMIVVPIYYLLPYLNATLQQLNVMSQKAQEMQGTFNSIQSAGQQVGGGMQDINKLIQELQSQLPKTQ
jgi:hypothetical protein